MSHEYIIVFELYKKDSFLKGGEYLDKCRTSLKIRRIVKIETMTAVSLLCHPNSNKHKWCHFSAPVMTEYCRFNGSPL